MSHLVQHFHRAVLRLTGPDPVKQRLTRAYVDHLSAIEEAELPRRAVERFAELRGRLHRVSPLNGEGPVRASVRKMSGPEAAGCAEIIVELYAAVSSAERERGAPLSLVSGGEAETVPGFLLKS